MRGSKTMLTMIAANAIGMSSGRPGAQCATAAPAADHDEEARREETERAERSVQLRAEEQRSRCRRSRARARCRGSRPRSARPPPRRAAAPRRSSCSARILSYSARPTTSCAPMIRLALAHLRPGTATRSRAAPRAAGPWPRGRARASAGRRAPSSFHAPSSPRAAHRHRAAARARGRAAYANVAMLSASMARSTPARRTTTSPRTSVSAPGASHARRQVALERAPAPLRPSPRRRAGDARYCASPAVSVRPNEAAACCTASATPRRARAPQSANRSTRPRRARALSSAEGSKSRIGSHACARSRRVPARASAGALGTSKREGRDHVARRHRAHLEDRRVHRRATREQQIGDDRDQQQDADARRVVPQTRARRRLAVGCAAAVPSLRCQPCRHGLLRAAVARVRLDDVAHEAVPDHVGSR